MRFLCGIIFSLLLVSCAYAQSAKIDSLRTVARSLTGTPRIDALNKLAWALVFIDLNKSKEVAKQARELSDQLNYTKGKAEALIDEGFCELKVGNTTVSIQKFKESIVLCRAANQDTLEGFALTYLGLNYQNLDVLDSSFYFLNQSYEILKDSIQPYYLSLVCMILADQYELTDQPDQQLNYLNRSWQIRKKLKDKRYLAYTSERLSSYFIQRGDFPEALSYLTEARLALGKDTVDNEEINIINKQRGIILLKQGQYPLALSRLSSVTKFYERNSFTKELTNLLIEIGYLFVDIDNYESSLSNYFKALALAEKNHYEFERAKALVQIGRVYFYLDQLPLGKKFASQGLKIAEEFKHPLQEASALNLLGLIADDEKKANEALQYFDRSLEIKKNINDQVGIAATVYNMAIVFEKQGDFKKALDYQLQSLAIEERLNHQIGMAYSYQSLGALYIKLKDFNRAGEYLTKGELLSRKIKSGKVLSDIYMNRRDLLLAKSKFEEAAKYSILYEHLRDSIFNVNLSTRIATLQNIFELDQKDNAIKILSQEKELQSEKLELQGSQIKQQWIVILTGSLGFIGLSIFSYFILSYYRKIKLLNREISERNEEIQSQSEELTESNESLMKLNRDIIERNEEIQAQSEELTEANDGLSKLNLEIYEQKEKIQSQAKELEVSNRAIQVINEHLEERIEERTSELKQAYKELDTFFYRSSHDFRRPLTTFMGLAEVAKITIKDSAALELFERVNETAHNLDKMLMKLQSISDVGVQELIYKEVFIDEIFKRELDLFSKMLFQKNIHTEIEVDPTLSFHSYPALVKIMVENLIENAVSFCGMVNPIIRLKAYHEKGEVVMEVEDNGQGIEEEYLGRVFDMYFRGNERSKGNGLGLYIVKKTADKLKARVTLKSKAGRGTKVSIFFPHQLEETVIKT